MSYINDRVSDRGRFREMDQQHKAVAASVPHNASGKPLSKEDQIQHARQTIGSVTITSNGQIFPGLLPESGNVDARFINDIGRSSRKVDIPDPNHPQSGTLRIMDMVDAQGKHHSALIEISNETHEATNVYVNFGKDGKPDQVGIALANSQHEMFLGRSGINFTDTKIQPLNDQHRALIKDVNHAIDNVYANHSQLKTDVAATDTSHTVTDHKTTAPPGQDFAAYNANKMAALAKPRTGRPT